MNNHEITERSKLFISKATPGDDAFALWLAPRLEAAGYEVFADILELDTGDSWRKKLTETLQDQSVKMLLCCSPETLKREGVLQEIGIAANLTKSLSDPNFILPLKLRRYDPIFGIVDLQYVDFESGWAEGLAKLLKSLEKQNVRKTSEPIIQSEWAAYHRRRSVSLKDEPEQLTSNWLRVLSIPDAFRLLLPKGSVDHSKLLKLSKSFPFPLVPHENGFISFAEAVEFDEHFTSVGTFSVVEETDFTTFSECGFPNSEIESPDAKRIVSNLMRQAWEIHCKQAGFLTHQFSNGTAQIVDSTRVDKGKRIPWGRQGQRRNSMLRNVAKGKVWEYGVSAQPSLFPFPLYKLKSRVLFSDLADDGASTVIDSYKVQHRLRRSIAGSWRNKAWHGRLMAFMELLAGESPYVTLNVGGGEHILLDAMPIQATSPVSARQGNKLGEDGEEIDGSTLGGHFSEDEA